MKLLISLLAMIAMVIAVSAGGDDMVTFPKKLDVTGFRAVFAEVDNLYISGQPEAASFEKLKEMGVTTVINLRTRREMDTREYVPFDEKEVVEQLGMDYIHIPLGGDDNPYNRAALDSFAEAYHNAEGKALLHCTMAWRASHMWAAYLITYEDLAPVKAIEHARAINFGELPLEGLLGKKMIIDFE